MKCSGNRARYWTVVIMFICLAACVAASNSIDLKVKSDTEMGEEEQTQEGITAAGLLTQQQQVDHAKQKLAQRLGTNLQEIELISASAVSWRTGALGCPKPDMGYMQALVPGVLIILKASGQRYRYHAKQYMAPFYCPNERAESPSTAASDI